jgi:acylpyruvate hydrolase
VVIAQRRASPRHHEKGTTVKIAVYGPDRRVAALIDEQVVDLNWAYAKYLREAKDASRAYARADLAVPANLQAFIEEGNAALEAAMEALEWQKRNPDPAGPEGEIIVQPLANVRLRAALPDRGNRVFMAIGNYADHSRGTRVNRTGEDISLQEVFDSVRNAGIGAFTKDTMNVVGPYDNVIYPRSAQRLDYEAEVTVVLGKAGANIPQGRAAEYIYGYTMHNDWSRRDVTDKAGPLSSNRMKNFDTSSSIGPCIVVGEIPDAQNIDFFTRVDGELRQSGNTKDMIFSFAEYLEYLSRDATLRPGELISGGTCAGTAMDASPYVDGVQEMRLFLKPGQVCEIGSPQIGVMRNPIIGE